MHVAASGAWKPEHKRRPDRSPDLAVPWGNLRPPPKSPANLTPPPSTARHPIARNLIPPSVWILLDVTLGAELWSRAHAKADSKDLVGKGKNGFQGEESVGFVSLGYGRKCPARRNHSFRKYSCYGVTAGSMIGDTARVTTSTPIRFALRMYEVCTFSSQSPQRPATYRPYRSPPRAKLHPTLGRARIRQPFLQILYSLGARAAENRL